MSIKKKSNNNKKSKAKKDHACHVTEVSSLLHPVARGSAPVFALLP